MPISIETIIPKWTGITICLMVSFAVSVFENVRTQLSFYSGQSIGISILFTTLYLLSVMFGKICFIALCTSGHIRAITRYQMFPFPTVFILWNVRVCICMSYAKSTHLENISPQYIPCQQIKPTLLTICLMAVTQLSRYSIFHNRDTPI